MAGILRGEIRWADLNPIRGNEQAGLRQCAGIDSRGRVFAYSGDQCVDWYGHRPAENYSVQGNMLVGKEKNLVEALSTPQPQPDSQSAAPSTPVAPPSGARAGLNSDGTATAPASAPEAVKAVIAAANQITNTPYIWGGGHGAWRWILTLLLLTLLLVAALVWFVRRAI